MTAGKQTSMRVFEIACVSCVAALSLWLVWGCVRYKFHLKFHHEWQLKDLIEQGATQDALTLLQQEPKLVNARIPYGSNAWQMPVHVATEYCNEEIVVWLLQNGANPNALDVSQVTPITRVVDFWNSNTTEPSRKMLELLIANGAEIDKKSGSVGESALHKAVWSDENADAVRVLLDCGASIDQRRDLDGRTALMVAAGGPLKECKEIINILLDHGADTKSKDRNHKTASMLASDVDHKDVVKLLEAVDQNHQP